MANGKYDAGREAFGNGEINWPVDNIRAVIVDTADYTVNLATHATLADIPSGARTAVSGNLAGKTNSGGVLGATDTSVAGVSGDPSEAVIVFLHTGTEGTSTLISYHDGLTLTPNGGLVTIEWHPSGIYAI